MEESLYILDGGLVESFFSFSDETQIITLIPRDYINFSIVRSFRTQVFPEVRLPLNYLRNSVWFEKYMSGA